MFENKTEAEARKEILDLVAEYADKFHNQKKEFHEGDRIPYASRVYDSREMVNLVDSSLEFWLTSGRYTDEFEKKLAEYLHVRYCALVNSGSSANLVAFMTLTSPLLGDRKYGAGEQDGCRIALWSYKISFLHPQSGQPIAFSAPPPAVFPWNLFNLSELS